MIEAAKIKRIDAPWSAEVWQELERQTCALALQAATDEAAWEVIARRARLVMRAYTTSFFIVTRFLPPAKRAQVEAIYAAVRYPDEIVDTFPLAPPDMLARLDAWEQQYDAALTFDSIRERLHCGVPSFIASFAEVVRRADIPQEHYRAFLDAMRHDAQPRRFATLADLIESYIYGSAIVVGYFLAYVYGENHSGDMIRALTGARHLGIALQLTNFLRDVGEDQARGRLYLPLDLLAEEGIHTVNVNDAGQQEALRQVVRRLAAITEDYYARAVGDVDAFAPDCQMAIRACIDVYRQLNDRIGRSPQGVRHRESVPMAEKFRVLPTSKYWRLPLAYWLEW